MQVAKKSDPGAKMSVANQLIEGLSELTSALQKRQPLARQFRTRRVTITLEPRLYDGKMVKWIRGRLGVSQAVFALFLGVSVKTVQSWEQGYLTPNKMARRFMDTIQEDTDLYRQRLEQLTMSNK
jgi:putative transcriptional regulator